MIGDLGKHPMAQHSEQVVEIHPLEQVKEGGVARDAGEIEAKDLIAGLPVPPGKALEIPRAVAVTVGVSLLRSS